MLKWQWKIFVAGPLPPSSYFGEMSVTFTLLSLYIHIAMCNPYHRFFQTLLILQALNSILIEQLTPLSLISPWKLPVQLFVSRNVTPLILDVQHSCVYVTDVSFLLWAPKCSSRCSICYSTFLVKTVTAPVMLILLWACWCDPFAIGIVSTIAGLSV